MKTPRTQRGIALVIIAVLLVLFVTIGIVMATRSGVQHMSVGLSVRAMQAWFAAQSGLEWAVHQSTASQVTHDAICDAGGTITTSFTLTGGASNDYDVSIICDDSGGFQEAGVTYEVDVITAAASRGNPGDITYATRAIQAVITTGVPLP